MSIGRLPHVDCIIYHGGTRRRRRTCSIKECEFLIMFLEKKNENSEISVEIC